jgi:hypothetical protein
VHIIARSSDRASRIVGPGRPVRRSRRSLGQTSPEPPPACAVGRVNAPRGLASRAGTLHASLLGEHELRIGRPPLGVLHPVDDVGGCTPFASAATSVLATSTRPLPWRFWTHQTNPSSQPLCPWKSSQRSIVARWQPAGARAHWESLWLRSGWCVRGRGRSQRPSVPVHGRVPSRRMYRNLGRRGSAARLHVLDRPAGPIRP